MFQPGDSLTMVYGSRFPSNIVGETTWLFSLLSLKWRDIMNGEQEPCCALSPIEVSFDFIQNDLKQDE